MPAIQATSWGEFGKKKKKKRHGDTSYIVGGNVKWYGHWGKQLVVSEEVEQKLSI